MSDKMKILLAAATPFEIAPVVEYLKEKADKIEQGHYHFPHIIISPFVHGVGAGIAAAQLSRMLALGKHKLLIQAGVAGAYDRNLQLGDVVQVIKDTFIDLGVEENDLNLTAGQDGFTSAFELGLIPPDEYPFEKGWIPIEKGPLPEFLPKVTGGTVNCVHGTAESIKNTLKKYPELQIETMEGAAGAYTAKIFQIPFLQIRSISNYVEPRNRAGWKIELAIEKLNEVLKEMVRALEG